MTPVGPRCHLQLLLLLLLSSIPSLLYFFALLGWKILSYHCGVASSSYVSPASLPAFPIHSASANLRIPVAIGMEFSRSSVNFATSQSLLFGIGQVGRFSTLTPPRGSQPVGLPQQASMAAIALELGVYRGLCQVRIFTKLVTLPTYILYLGRVS